MNILVSGMIAAHPRQGGATWAVLQYVLGLKALGHEVHFIELIAEEKVTPRGAPISSSVNARYFETITAAFGLEGSAALVSTGSRQTVGMSFSDLVRIAQRSDCLLNISGTLTFEELLEPVPVRVYLDLDPAFAQVWHLQGIDMGFERHTHFVTVARAIGDSGCAVPMCGQSWIRTLQPVVLDYWPMGGQIPVNSLTTIGNWRGYGSVVYDGVHYGQKAHSLRPFFALPKWAGSRFQLAMSIHPDEREDLSALAENGWELIDPLQVAGTPEDYRQFIQNSWAEFGIAKSGYVASRCGWFSDRSVCYLASGRPVLAQDTAFSRYLPSGEGLFAFTTADDVVAGIECLKRDYRRHSDAARQIAETYFDSNKVLSSLLDAVGT